MSDLFHNLTDKLGITKETITDQAENLLNQNRDRIPDSIEGQIEQAIHGDMVGGLLEKIGIGGSHEEAAATEEATDEQETEESDDNSSEDEDTEETDEASDDSDDEEESDDDESDDDEESDDSDDSK